jgi:hypothetical protein
MLPVEKPGSPAEVLEHHGTKGMKWGVTRSSRAFATKHPTNRSRAKEIHRARARQQLALTKIGTEENKGNRINMKKAYLNNPDRATALRMTRGEKVVAGLVAGILIPTGIGPPAVAIGLGARVAVRRHIEKNQAGG